MGSYRILFIIDYFYPHLGGAETVFHELISRLAKDGHTIGVLTIQHNPTLPTYEETSLYTIRRTGSTRKNFHRYGFRKAKEIIKDFDFIHSATYASIFPSRLIAKIYQRKYIVTIHEVFGPLRKKIKPTSRLAYICYEWAIMSLLYREKYVTVSRYTAHCIQDWYGFSKTRGHVVYNGVNESERTHKKSVSSFGESFKLDNIQDTDFLFVYTGHGGASKGIDQLIEAIPSIVNTLQDVHICINLLPCQRNDELCQKISTLPTSHVTLLHGLPKEDQISLLAEADAVIVPSLSEGFGLVAAETSLLGTPLICTKNGSLPEVVSGKVIYLEDITPQQFVIACKKAIQNKWQITPKKHFSRDTMTANYLKIYKNLYTKNTQKSNMSTRQKII